MKIPDYAYQGFIEKEWGVYIKRVLNRGEPEFGKFSYAVDGATIAASCPCVAVN